MMGSALKVELLYRKHCIGNRRRIARPVVLSAFKDAATALPQNIEKRGLWQHMHFHDAGRRRNPQVLVHIEAVVQAIGWNLEIRYASGPQLTQNSFQ